MFINTRNRYLAAGIHLGISIAIFSLLVFMLLQFWYPSPFFSASGGWQGLRIVAFIDIVMGPLLTLVLVNAHKSSRELLSDLSLVAAMQITALGWGVYTIYQQRPVAIAFLDYSFYTVPANELINQGVDLHSLKKFGPKLPVYVYVEKPKTAEALASFKESTSDKKMLPFYNTDYYRPIDDHLGEIYKHSLDIDAIMAKNSHMKGEIMALVGNENDPAKALKEHHYIGLVSRYRNVVVVFDKNDKVTGYASAPYKLAP